VLNFSNMSTVTAFWTGKDVEKQIFNRTWKNGESKLMNYLTLLDMGEVQLVDKTPHVNCWTNTTSQTIVNIENFKMNQTNAGHCIDEDGTLIRTTTSTSGITLRWTVPKVTFGMLDTAFVGGHNNTAAYTTPYT